MPLLQLIFSLIVFISFFLALLVIAWYIAIPVLVLWMIFGGIRWIQNAVLSYRYHRQANGCSMKRSQSHTPKATVIDVDYTELN